ncbi:MAG: M20/M25/M40 family metallo-hydrolase [Gemmatimonadales bacterium]|nr:M20/M25/M40 family metallo-hydrolase [Gemmatimonadales bacterium]
MTAMPGRPHRGVLSDLSDEERALSASLAGHVRVLAEEIGDRNVWRLSRLALAGKYIQESLTSLGYTPNRQRYEAMGIPVENLEVELPGTSKREEIVIVGAHYDSVRGCPGANDNASGVAALLELARVLQTQSFSRTVRLVAFVNEEPPFCFTSEMGSDRYAARSQARAEKIAAMVSLETIGYYSAAKGSQRYPMPFDLLYPSTGDFIAFVGNLRSRGLVRRSVGAFRRATRFPSEGVAAPGFLPGIYWSDQWSFWRRGYRAVMVTDTAPFRYPAYHTEEDTPEKVDYDRLARVVGGLEQVVLHLAND